MVGGCDDNDEIMKDCEKFDVYNNKWVPMPPLNFERGNPGTFITEDKKHLYAFQGFKTLNNTEKSSIALNTIEFLDLTDPNAQW